MAFYIKKTFVDSGPGIELVNIHYTWTPVGEMPNWEAPRETRAISRGGVLMRGMGGTTLDESGMAVQTAVERVELPEPVTDVGLKILVAPLGRPLTLKLTLPVKPPDGVTVAVYEVPAPAVTVRELGVVEMLKSGPPPPVVGTVTFP